jgi:serine/threonine protein kinase
MPDYTTQLALGSQIGGGHFGDVFEAQCPLNGRVAVKLLRQNPGESNSDWAARSAELLSEAQKLKSAQHRNVVGVHQVVKDANGVVHLVAEFCRSGSLEGPYLAGPMPLHEVRRIATDACAGLECIHSRGMVHRDVKPGNILGDDGVFKIGDFGLVTDRLLKGYASAAGYTSHLAPEVFGATGATSPKTDVWALGMTAYRLLHGHGFYQDQFGMVSPTEFETRITRGGFSQSLPWLPHVPEKWRRFVRKAMHDDSTRRFQSAHEMSQALALLPVEPLWSCRYKYDLITWEQSKNGRTTSVEWSIHSPRKHSWSANRMGGGKRSMRVGGTGGAIVNLATVRAQLEDFFATSG